MKIIKVITPTRVDLGGGTLDIWPIYLLHDNNCTINIAINLLVEVTLILHNNKLCRISLNNKLEKFYINSLNCLPKKGTFELINNIIKFFKPVHAFDLNIKINTPKGSGLGTSSSLAIALCKTFQIVNNIKYSKKELIDLAMGLETQILKLPTGKQDYLAALYGSINCWHFGPLGYIQNKISINNEELHKRSILCYVGKPHYSASSNWLIFKKRLERNKKIINYFEKIRDATLEIKDALIKQNWNKLAIAINTEWENRKKLSPYLETPEMKNAISIAFKYGAIAAKGCGAAQGGTLYFLVKPEKKEKITNALLSKNFTILPFEINTKGLTYEIK